MNPRGEFEVEKNVQILNNYGKKSDPRGERGAKGRVGETSKSSITAGKNQIQGERGELGRILNLYILKKLEKISLSKIFNISPLGIYIKKERYITPLFIYTYIYIITKIQGEKRISLCLPLSLWNGAL